MSWLTNGLTVFCAAIVKIRLCPNCKKSGVYAAAAEQQAEIGLVYRKPDGQNYRRRVVPVEVGNGVLIAECRERNALRRFEIKRIINILD